MGSPFFSYLFCQSFLYFSIEETISSMLLTFIVFAFAEQDKNTNEINNNKISFFISKQYVKYSVLSNIELSNRQNNATLKKYQFHDYIEAEEKNEKTSMSFILCNY